MKVRNILLELTQYYELIENVENRRVLEEALRGYTPVSVRDNRGVIECNFFDNNDYSAVLQVSDDNLTLSKIGEYEMRTIRINISDRIDSYVCEKRNDGIIISHIVRMFGAADYPNGKRKLTDLSEKRSVFTYKTLCMMTGKKYDINSSLVELMNIINLGFLDMWTDLETRFESSLHTLVRDNNGRFSINNNMSVYTALNGVDISHIFTLSEGEDRIERIYDLYNGVINDKTAYDIHMIYMGRLLPDAFDLKGVRGITQQENILVGKSLIPEDKTYLRQIDWLIDDRYGDGVYFEKDLTTEENIKKQLKRMYSRNCL